MLRLLQFLFTGCWHTWEILDRGNMVSRAGDLPFGKWWECRCTKCGKPKYWTGS